MNFACRTAAGGQSQPFDFQAPLGQGTIFGLAVFPTEGLLLRRIGMTPAEEYRQHAANCLEAAKFASREDVRKVLVSMAQRWERNAALFKDLPAASGPKAD
jgi:hypothetical protein